MTRLLLVAAVALVAVLAAAGVGVGAGAEWHVHPGAGTPIQMAIDGAEPGDTIYVHAGMYVENVDVNKRLTLPVLAPSVDAELTPDEDPAMPGVQVINEIPETNRTVTITANVTDPDDYKNITSVTADITCLGTVGGNPVSLTFVSNSSATIAKYTGRFNMSDHQVGGYEVVVRATNTGGFTGTTSESFTYLHEATAPLHLSPFIIYGSVSYADGASCNSPFVVITNLNTSEELIADNRTGEGFYQLVTNSTFANAGDVLRINAHKDGRPVGNATHTVNQTDIGNAVIRVDVNKRYLSDFTVTNLTFDMPEPLLIGDLVMINAMITNSGAEGETSVEFYDNKSITIERTQSDYLESPVNDAITLPDILRIRVHFKSFDVSSGGNITIYNESRMVERITRNGWTEWCDGDTVRIESWNAGFAVDRYEAVLANKSITLGEGYFINLSAKWNLSLQEMGWATNGTHNITVRVDSCDQVIESDEANNKRTEAIDVDPSLDFAVTKISLDPSEPVLGDVVEVSANITNYGVRDGTTVVGVYYDNRSMEIKRRITSFSYSTDNISLPADVHGLRIRFSDYLLGGNAYINIYDENGRLVERIHQMGEQHGAVWIGRDYWTDCIYSNAVTIEMYSGGGTTTFTIDRYEALIAEEPVTLNATESKVINASWRTGAAYGGVGDHNITVMVDLHDHSVETNETNNTLIEQVLVNGTDLTVTAIELSCGFYPARCYVGQDVTVTTTIANLGAVDATNFTVVFLDGICSDYGDANISDNNFTNVHIERLNSGESRNISVIWNPLETGWHTITASIPYDNTDDNETNNKLFDYAEVEPFCDFVVESVSVPQGGVRRGESVDITATIGNSDKGLGGGNVSVAFFVNTTDYAGSCGERFIRIRTLDDVYVEVGETKTVSINWDVDVAGGCHLIAAVANPDEEVEEIEGITPFGDGILFRGDIGNNVKNCTLHVNPLDLDITNIALVLAEPNIDDLVDVSATIRNNESTEARSTVWFYMEKNYSQSRVLQPEDIMMRVHLDIKINNERGGEVTASVNDSEGDDRPVHFYVKCGEYGGHDMEVRRVEGEGTDCFYEIESDGYRHWDDVWTEWVNGTAIEINAEGDVILSIDKYQVRLGNETIALGPGESMVYHSTWNTSPPIKAGEYYRGMVNVEDQKSYSNETYLHGTDLAVTNLSVKSPVYDGDMVWVNATIENLGRMDATDFIVNFTEVYRPTSEVHPETSTRIMECHDHLELINTTRIEGLGAGRSIDISVSWNVSIRDIECEGVCWGRPCSWNEIADDYHIKVEINPLESTSKEENDANNTEEAGVHVNNSRDFEITDLSFRVNNESRNSSELVVYDDVTLNATLDITNLANQGGSVNVSFYIDDACAEHEIGNTTVAFPVGNGTGYAEIEWKVENFDGVDIAGEHNMTVVVDPENRIYEIDDVNNTYTQPIHARASEDLVLESLCVNPESPMRGDGAYINVTIANVGRMNASDVILIIYDWAERHIEDVDEQTGSGQIEITRENAAAMRLYLDLNVDGGGVCINDSSGREIIHYDRNFHGWTPWVLDDSTTIVVTDSAYAKVSKVYYLASGSIIDTSTHDLGINETTNVTVNWDVSVGGERFIAAIIDPENDVIESDEFNNRLVEFVSVQTADIEVSNLSLWLNGTEIGENEIIKHGDDVTIVANLANIGIEEAGDFSVRFLVDDILIKNKRIGGLAPDGSICVSVDWNAMAGDPLVKVEADWENAMDETNETNNIAALERYVCGAELSGNISWETMGLYGETLFETTQPYDEDEVVITAKITNSGCLDATDFNAALFFDYTSDDEFQKKCGHFVGGTWINRTYQGAEYVYINVTTPDLHGYCRPITKDDVIIYDGNGSEVARPEKPCWVRVNGDTANVFITPQGGGVGPVFDIYFYPIYQNGTSMLFEGIDVPANSSHNFLIKRNVNAGDRTVMFLIDPENKVPEEGDHRKDHTVSRIMHVNPTRDFMVMDVTGEGTNIADLDTQTITAEISNIGLRNGTTDVSFVDYEVEHRTYNYHFDINRSPSYLPIPPDAKLSGLRYEDEPFIQHYDNLMIIHRPGVDMLELHFDVIYLAPPAFGDARTGVISVYDENGTNVWTSTSGSYGRHENDVNIPVQGETAYIYTCKASFNLDRYTTKTEFHREEVQLNASKTWNESKNITPIRTVYIGDHNITVTLDEDDKISEISESNNELSSTFHVNASRDPAIAGINITPEHPGDGDDVDITAVVANNGYKTASFTVDLWANLTRDKPGADESLPDPDLTTDLGEGKIRYITLLKHATVTLAPGENTTVHATWNDVSIAGSPEHHIIAIVDPTDEIDEINESNNEIVKRIIPNYPIYPDLTIGTAHVRGGTGEVVVPIEEIGGASGASDVAVRFEAYETEKCSKSVYGWDVCSISHRGASNLQVYFNNLDSKDGYVIVNDRRSSRDYIKKYSGVEFAGVWSPWVKGDTIWIISGGAGTYASITKYRWGNVSDEQIEYLPAGGSERVEIPWAYECPRNVYVRVDPDNNIAELNEDNNEKSVLIYADLRAERIEFVSPRDTMLSLDADKFVIDGYITNSGDEDGIIVPVSDFDVTLEFRKRYPNGTVGDVVFGVTGHVEEPLYANEDRAIRFEFDPSEELEVGGNYAVFLIADSAGDVCESNDLYSLGEYNNVASMNIYVYNSSGYTGSSNLTNIAQGEVHGRVAYTIGDSRYTGLTSPGGEKTVRYTGVVPDDADIEFARIFVYWFTWHREGGRMVPVLADVNATFNGHSLTKAGNYSDTPGATASDIGYGMYSYDVTGYVTSGENEATVKNNAEWNTGIHAIGLLVVYEDEAEPLTKYWINEGADIMMGANSAYPTGLPGDGCITAATFEGVEQNDTENVNAALLTVLGMYTQFGESVLFSDEGDALKFNNQSIGSLIGTGYWEYHYRDTGIALTMNGWEDVTDHLKPGDNLAEIQSTGNFMMPNNAFLRLIFSPDLNITDLTAPDSIVVGKAYPINVTIRNDGRSDAHDFNVTLCIDGKQMVRIPHLDLPAGNSTTLHLYNWTPMMLDHVYNLTVTADILSGEDWTEVEVDNNGVIVNAGAPGVGDLNGDGIITPADAAIALRLAVTGAYDPAADVSGDNRVTSLDAFMILQAAAGWIELW